MELDKSAGMASRRTVFVLITALILDLLAFTCILPLLPTIFDFYSTEKHRDWLYDKFISSTKDFQTFIGVENLIRFNNVFLGGFIGSLFSGLQFLSSPLLGALSDAYGRKPLLLLSITGTLFSYLVWSQAATFTIFLIFRLIGGLSKANVSISTAIISDIYSPKTIGKGMALIGVAFSVGFVVGPMFGAYFSNYAKTNLGSNSFYSTPAYFATALTFLELIIILFFFKETLPKTRRKTKSTNILRNCLIYVKPNALFAFKAVEKTLTQPAIKTMGSYGKAYFLYLFFYSGMEFTLSFLTQIRFQYDSMQQGKMYLFVGIIMVLVQGGFARRIPCTKHLQYAIFGILMIIPAFLIIGFSQNRWIFYLGLALYSVSSGLVVPCLTSCVSNLSSPQSKGATLGVFRSLGAFSRALGPMFFSTVFWLAGPEVCYFLGGVLLLSPALILKKISRSLSETKLN